MICLSEFDETRNDKRTRNGKRNENELATKTKRKEAAEHETK